MQAEACGECHVSDWVGSCGETCIDIFTCIASPSVPNLHSWCDNGGGTRPRERDADSLTHVGRS